MNDRHERTSYSHQTPTRASTGQLTAPLLYLSSTEAGWEGLVAQAFYEPSASCSYRIRERICQSESPDPGVQTLSRSHATSLSARSLLLSSFLTKSPASARRPHSFRLFRRLLRAASPRQRRERTALQDIRHTLSAVHGHQNGTSFLVYFEKRYSSSNFLGKRQHTPVEEETTTCPCLRSW